MWDDLVRRLSDYPSAVLTVFDADDRPFSIRCEPDPDHTRRVLEIEMPDYLDARAGRAALLCHFHDDELWSQTNFLAHGDIEGDGDRWIFRPTRLIEGAGAGNRQLHQMRFRKTAFRYVRRHDMEWPEVPWARLRTLYRQARQPER